jgi:hypothetical protein
LQTNNARCAALILGQRVKTTQTQYLLALDALNIERHRGTADAGKTNRAVIPWLCGRGIFQCRTLALAGPRHYTGPTGCCGRWADASKPIDACAPQTENYTPADYAALPVGTARFTMALDDDASCGRGQNQRALECKPTSASGRRGNHSDWWTDVWDRHFAGRMMYDRALCWYPDVNASSPIDIQLAVNQTELLATHNEESRWCSRRLLYCTCSVFVARGDAQAKRSLTHHTDAFNAIRPLRLKQGRRCGCGQHPSQLTGEHDGFFYYALF